MAIAMLFLFQASRYHIGDLSKAGPGLFPILIAGILSVIGVVIIVRSRLVEAVPLQFVGLVWSLYGRSQLTCRRSLHVWNDNYMGNACRC